MIIQSLLMFVFDIINYLLLPFDAIGMVVSSSYFTTFGQYLSAINYIIPMANFIPIIAFLISTMALRVLVALLKTVWDILPLV